MRWIILNIALLCLVLALKTKLYKAIKINYCCCNRHPQLVEDFKRASSSEAISSERENLKKSSSERVQASTSERIMGKGGKRLQNASQEIKELQEYNHELQDQIDMKDKLIKTLEMKLIQNQNIIDHMVDTMQSVNDL